MQLYKISFSSTPKVYIGISSVSAESRFKIHSTKSKYPIGKALKKHGADNAVLTILAEHDDWSTLCQMEMAAIIEHNSKVPNGYNLTDGGEGVLGLKRTEEQNKNHSELMKLRFSNPEARKLLSKYKKDYIANNPEAWAKQMANSIAATQTPEYRQAKSEQTKVYIAENPEEFAKTMAKSKKTHQTLEARKLYSEKNKAYIAANPEKESNRHAKIKATMQTQEARKAVSERNKTYIALNPEEFAKARAKAKEKLSTQEARQIASERAKLMFSTPEAKKVFSECQKLRFSTTEAKVRQRCAIAVGWAKKQNRPYSPLPREQAA